MASDIPHHKDFNEGALLEALSLVKVWKTDTDLVDTSTNAKAVNPGKFKGERKWPEWEQAFVNYLSVIPGVNGVPLSYVIREEEQPLAGMVYETHNEILINHAPLVGNYFITDTRWVHNLLVGFIQGEASENWICSIAKYQDGRRDFIVLRQHYAGEGNATRRRIAHTKMDSEFSSLYDRARIAI
jgi:hypothetical protein